MPFMPTEITIREGDTLSEIAQMFDTTVSELVELNNIKNANFIRAGDTLKLPRDFLEKAKKRPEKTQKKESRATKKIDSDSFLPINIRQILNPLQDRTEKDLSKEERDVLKEVIARSQTPERIAEKKAAGLNPYAIEYKDYETTEKGAQYADVGGGIGLLGLFNKLQNPAYNLKTFLGQASAIPQEGGGYKIQDVYDFKPKTERQGLGKFAEYLSSIGGAGFNPYNQVRNFMGYYGPQEGTGEGGRSNIRIMQQGGDTMDIQQQTKNVAAQGRYGDSMLLHVNPAEVKGLASAMPITVNPQTGQPEAFLPFLAPIFGSMLGGSLLAGKTIAGVALSKAAAAGIGAGLAQTAVTGDIKEGLKAGLTAGMGARIFGGGAEAQKFAEGAQKATDVATNINTDVLLQDPSFVQPGELVAGQMGPPPPVLNPAGQIELANMMPDASNYIAQGGKDAVAAYSGNVAGPGAATFGEDFSTVFSDGVGQGLSNIGSAAMNDPLALATLGTTGTMYGMDMMQADYEEQMARMQAEREEKRRQNMLMNPEPILYSAEGGVTNFRRGGEIDDDITRGDLPQIFAPAKQAYQVNPDFMPGFSPETMYFNPATISAPASGLRPGAPPVGTDTYTGSKGGYGGRQASIAPQVSIDPFAAYTGQPPTGLEFTNTSIPMPIEPMPELPVPPVLPPAFDPIFRMPGMPGMPPFLNIDDFRAEYAKTNPTPPGGGKAVGAKRRAAYEVDLMNAFDDYQNVSTVPQLMTAPPIEYTNMPSNNAFGITGEDLGITQPRTLGELLPPGTDNGIDISDFLGSREDTLAGAQAMFGPQVTFATGLEPSTDSGMGLGLGEMMTAEELIARGGTPQPRGSGIFGKGPIVDSDVSIPTNYMFGPPIRERKTGGDTLKPIPEDNKGLPNLPKDVRNEMGYMQEGGMTDIQSDPLTREVTAFLLGESNNEEALNMFLTKYGNEAFMQLREAVLQSVVPGAQTEGLIRGDGQGGMDDDLRGMIGDKERIAVSQDEFIVPADVVSMLGDGSSDAGSKELYDMMDRVRKEKTGTTKQAPRLANAGGLLPA